MDGREPADRSGSGYRSVPHTADLRVEAWAPTAEGCIGELVRAVVDSFADLSGARIVGERGCTVVAVSDTDLLVGVLEEVIYRMDADGQLPVAMAIGRIEGLDGARTVAVRFRMADAATAALVGAVPKAVSLHDLDLRAGPDGWTCRVTVDV
ncbi:SHS2 domain-containing protein [Streptomyces sp. 1114.5]|uniref:archease n=1 Tax=unclassified Streptomyces TaxID=2593676 RepID=UPI000BDA3D1D|nr:MULTISPECIES: archease [unclassified Streptomyces]RKT19781.1 SHS2 domain-containing protein [Streptomyces sp. 1114.5]SOB85980.1 SHS2 domain-containing protein [Streptomyces sp. 1331.2]